MDVNELLVELLGLARLHLRGGVEIDTERLASGFLALDEWLRKGGFPPEEWVSTRGEVYEGDVDIPEGHVPEPVEMRSYALLIRNGAPTILHLRGHIDIKLREECRRLMAKQMEAEAVWFEDEIGTPLDKSDRLPGPHPNRDEGCIHCHALGKKKCPVHGKRR